MATTASTSKPESKRDQSPSVYERTIKTATEVKTLSSHMSALGKIRAGSEDDELSFYIEALIRALQFYHQQSYARSTPTSLTFDPIMETVRLLDYCSFHTRSNKPEWQVIAERNGWSSGRL